MTHATATAGRDLVSLSASEMARQVARGQTTSEELIEAHIRRIEAVNPRLNAVVLPRFDDARREAAAADQAVRSGQPLGPLHGVPITIKECFHVAGLPATEGIDGFAGEIIAEDGPPPR
jgi:Asp-tRNA(Asn)/Glu-tRNA(Gln) amidotransferase A subunit family amidase